MCQDSGESWWTKYIVQDVLIFYQYKVRKIKITVNITGSSKSSFYTVVERMKVWENYKLSWKHSQIFDDHIFESRWHKSSLLKMEVKVGISIKMFCSLTLTLTLWGEQHHQLNEFKLICQNTDTHGYSTYLSKMYAPPMLENHVHSYLGTGRPTIHKLSSSI